MDNWRFLPQSIHLQKAIYGGDFIAPILGEMAESAEEDEDFGKISFPWGTDKFSNEQYILHSSESKLLPLK